MKGKSDGLSALRSRLPDPGLPHCTTLVDTILTLIYLMVFLANPYLAILALHVNACVAVIIIESKLPEVGDSILHLPLWVPVVSSQDLRGTVGTESLTFCECLVSSMKLWFLQSEPQA